MNRQPSANLFRLRRRLTDEQVAAIARSIANAIRAQATGPLDDPKTWTDAAYRLGCKVRTYRHDPAVGPGYYDANAPGGPTLYYESTLNAPAACRRVIHELAHHVQATWPGTRFRKAAPERYDDDRQTVQHRVAQRVEEIMVGDL
jgi:hypothetical protein